MVERAEGANPVVLVTGASGGIGAAIAECAAADGFDLALVARSADGMRAIGDRLAEDYGVVVDCFAHDLTDPAAPAALARDIAERGLAVRVLVNNAGYGKAGPVAEIPLDEQLGMIDLNCRALIDLTRRFLPAILAGDGGRRLRGVLNIGSMAGFKPGPGMAVYYATKAFVFSFSEALRFECRGTGATVTVVCPGPVRTGFASRAGVADSRLFNSGWTLDARSVAEAGWRGFKRGKPVVIPGAISKLLRAAGMLTTRGAAMRMAAGGRKGGAARPR